MRGSWAGAFAAVMVVTACGKTSSDGAPIDPPETDMSGAAGLRADVTDAGRGSVGGEPTDDAAAGVHAGGEAGASPAVSPCPLAEPVNGDIIVPTDEPTIQAALDAAVDGQTVVVEAGTYFEHLVFPAKAVRLVSREGPRRTILDGEGVAEVVSFAYGGPKSAALVGFTIQHGYGFFGGAVDLNDASPVVEQNIFYDNEAWGGAFASAIGGSFSSALVRRNLFVENFCVEQFGMGTASFRGDSEPVIADNYFIGNDCPGVGITIYGPSVVRVFNNTFVDNRVGIQIYADIWPNAGQQYRNNLIAGGGIGLAVDAVNGAVPDEFPGWSHNLVSDNAVDYQGAPDWTGQGGNIWDDPRFVAPLEGDYRLAADSPAIDGGDLASSPPTGEDFDGDDRMLDGDGDGEARVDIGADEFSAWTRCVGVIAPPLRPAP
jgi:serine protease